MVRLASLAGARLGFIRRNKFQKRNESQKQNELRKRNKSQAIQNHESETNHKSDTESRKRNAKQIAIYETKCKTNYETNH